MIEYYPGKWQVSFIFQLHGSVFPKALMWALPSSALCLFLKLYSFNHWQGKDSLTVSQVWVAYNFVLGFLIVFRTNQAHERFWEGATILQQVRGEWYNAISCCVAFCNPS